MDDEPPFRLAHLSDPHLRPLPRLRFKDLINKRALGLTNYGSRRRQRHDMQVLAAIVADLRAQEVDHVAVTGDLVNLGLESEFDPALGFLAELGPPCDVSLVPGNHDAYLHPAIGPPSRAWGAYMRGDGADAPSSFPYIRRRGRVGIVGVSSAVPTWLLSAAGRIGAEQAGRVGEALQQLGREELFRVVLLHHPPSRRGASHFRRLADAQSFREVLALCGAELVLHGHNHRASRTVIAGAGRSIPVIGVPSASMGVPRPEAAAYNIYQIGGRAGAWRCTMMARGLGAGGIAEQRRLDLH